MKSLDTLVQTVRDQRAEPAPLRWSPPIKVTYRERDCHDEEACVLYDPEMAQAELADQLCQADALIENAFVTRGLIVTYADLGLEVDALDAIAAKAAENVIRLPLKLPTSVLPELVV